MAVTLQKKEQRILTNIVKLQTESFVLQRERYRDKVEGDFSRRVMDEGLKYSDQQDFYEALLGKEKKRRVPDQSYIKELKDKVANFKKLVRAEKFADEYRRSFNALVQGRKSLDAHIDLLNNELDGAIDSDLKNTINEKLTEALTKQVEINQTVFENKIKFAENDKSESVLTDMISQVKTKLQKIEQTDEEYASSLRLSLQSLESSLQASRIESDIQDAVMEGLNNPNPITKLNKINSMVKTSNADTPIFIEGTRYDSASDFWTQKRSEYLQTGDFANELSEYYSKKINVANIRSKEALPMIVKETKASLDALLKRADLAEYRDQLSDTVDLTVAYGTNLIGQNIVSKAKQDYNFDYAAQKLSEVNRWSGVDMTESYQQIVDEVSDLNFEQAQSINANAQEYLSNNPNASFGKALDWALKATPNTIISPEELSTKKPEEILKERVEEGKGEVSQIKPTSKAVGEAARNATQFNEGELIKTSDKNTVYKVEGGKLRAFTGSWDDDTFKYATGGKSFKAVKTVENLGDYEMGKDIIKQQATLIKGKDKQVVDVGSKRATELQQQGYKLA